MKINMKCTFSSFRFNLCMENHDLNMLLPVIHKLKKPLKNKQKKLDFSISMCYSYLAVT